MTGTTVTGPDPGLHRSLLPLTARITGKRMVTPEACRFELHAADGGPLPPFAAGAHINIGTPRGDVRSYSLTDDPDDSGDHYAITVHRNGKGRGGSVSLVDDTQVGDLVQISVPANAFALSDAPRYLLIAGGIGITPIRSMFRSLRRRQADVRLLYLTRSPGLTAYLDEFTAPDVAGQVILHHSDLHGPVDLWPHLAAPGNTHLYFCGPAPLLDEILALTMHWRPSAVHYEQFSGVSALGGTSTAFQARWDSTGEIIDVPADVTFLDALQAAGKQIPSSCRTGTCGTCRISLVSGDVEHRDLVLTADERRTAVMPCVSRGTGPLISVDL